MFYQLNGADVVFQFIHCNEESCRETRCVVTDVATQKVLTEAVAKVSPKDNYNKEIGRQVSLGRAIQNVVDDKSTRLDIWKKYSTWRIPEGSQPRMTLHE